LVINDLSIKKAEDAAKILEHNGAMEVVNGWTIEREPVKERVVDVNDPESLIEPDEPNTDLLGKLTLAVTIIIIMSYVGVKMLFEYTIADTLKSENYSTTTQAIAPSYRVVEGKKSNAKDGE
jgi:hypothetical protein